jgi:hypothetical protein
MDPDPDPGGPQPCGSGSPTLLFILLSFPGDSGFVILLFMIFTNFQIKFLDKEATMVKLGSSAGVGAGVDLKEKEEVKGGQSNASSAFTISSDICPHICLVGDQ